MFLESAFTKNNKFINYLLGSIVVIFAVVVGQIPMIVAVMIKIFQDHKKLSSFSSQTIMQVLDKNSTFFLLLISFVFGMAALLFVIKKIHGQTILQVTTARKKVDWNRIFFSFALWGVFIALSTIISYYESPENYVWNFQWQPFLILFFIAVALIPVQTSLEEYLFRGYLMQGFAVLSKNRWFPLLMTSTIFGSLHLMNPEIDKLGYIMLVHYIGTGLLLGIMTLMDDGMELALGFHAANNLLGCLLVTADWTALQTNSVLLDISEPSINFEIIAPVVLIYPILLFIFSKKYGWSGWQEKLTGNINL